MAAVPVAAQLAATGRALVATPSTMLSDLVSKSALDPQALAVITTTEDVVLNYATMVSVATDDAAGQPSMHTLAMGAYVDDIAKAVGSHISYARNTVKPLVVELAERIAAVAQRLKTTEVSTGVDLVIEKLPEVLKDESFLDGLNYYKDRTPVEPTRLEMAPKTNEEIRELMLTGHQRTDEMIAAWMSEHDPNFARKIWAAYFGIDRDMMYDTFENLTQFGKIDYVLGVYLVARKIFDNVQESDLPLASYKERCLQIRDWAGSQLTILLKGVQLLIANKMLVVAMYQNERKIHVNGELYAGWLASGGKPEVIMGMLANGNRISNIDLINEKTDELERAWNTYMVLRATENANRFYADYRVGIISEFTSQMGAQDESEKALNESNSQRVDNAIKAAAAWIDAQKNADLDDNFCVALHLVGCVRFCHTSAFQILNDINEACKVNPNVDVREAATLAVINYLGDWLADQITIKT
jgi:hypothetical protein